MLRYLRVVRRCGCGYIWLLVCTSYIILTLYLNMQQSQHSALLEMRRRESKAPTTREWFVPGDGKHEMHRPVIYNHLILKNNINKHPSNSTINRSQQHKGNIILKDNGPGQRDYLYQMSEKKVNAEKEDKKLVVNKREIVAQASLTNNTQNGKRSKTEYKKGTEIAVSVSKSNTVKVESENPPNQKSKAKLDKKSMEVHQSKKQPANSGKKQPADSGKKQPTDSGKKQPADLGKKQPADSGKKQPADSGKKQPADSGKKQPADSRKKQPADSGKKQLADSSKEQPADSGKKQPADSGKKQLADLGKKQPADSEKKQPADSGKKQLEDSGKKQLADSEKKQPADSGKKQPADSSKKQLEVSSKKQLADSGKKQPADSEKKQPADSGKKQLEDSSKKQLEDSGKKQLADSEKKQPADSEKKQPADSVKNSQQKLKQVELSPYHPQEQELLKKNKSTNQEPRVMSGNKIKQNSSAHLPPAPPGFLGVRGKTILLWTNLTTMRPMWNFKTWSLKRCPYKCQITNDRTYLSQASLVLFRLRMLQTIPDKFLREFVEAYDITSLPERKYSNQVWVDVNQESPMYSHSDEELMAVDNSFNYVVSYHSHSDYTYDYKFLYRKRATPLPTINYAANKTKQVLWYVSHCKDLSGRWRYVKELKKYNISIDIYGKCTGMRDGCEGYKDVNCVNAIKSKYKFYLAFENSICSEYITEKFWNILNSSLKVYIIPIALGARLHEYERLSPPNSFLHVRNFTGAKDLAQYIHKIDREDKMFNFYHQWRASHETYMEKREKLDCWLCRMAHQQPPTNRTSYSKFWSRQKLCDQKPEPI